MPDPLSGIGHFTSRHPLPTVARVVRWTRAPLVGTLTDRKGPQRPFPTG